MRVAQIQESISVIILSAIRFDRRSYDKMATSLVFITLGYDIHTLKIKDNGCNLAAAILNTFSYFSRYLFTFHSKTSLMSKLLCSIVLYCTEYSVGLIFDEIKTKRLYCDEKQGAILSKLGICMQSTALASVWECYSNKETKPSPPE